MDRIWTRGSATALVFGIVFVSIPAALIAQSNEPSSADVYARHRSNFSTLLSGVSPARFNCAHVAGHVSK